MYQKVSQNPICTEYKKPKQIFSLQNGIALLMRQIEAVRRVWRAALRDPDAAINADSVSHAPIFGVQNRAGFLSSSGDSGESPRYNVI